MTTWEAILLGVVQGLTEFLPVSSSGHLELTQYLLGFSELKKYILFNIVCHLGTLGAIGLFFFKQIRESLIDKRKLGQICLATLPLFPLVLLLKPLKSLFDQPELLGFFFLFTAFLLFVGNSIVLKQAPTSKQKWKDSLTIGLFQALAVIPGISRSGSTISAARLLGWKKEEAISFSFLLAIPAILGATTLEIIQLFSSTQTPFESAQLMQFSAGFITSFIVGCLALKLLYKLFDQNKWSYFAWYCLSLGCLSLFYFNFWR